MKKKNILSAALITLIIMACFSPVDPGSTVGDPPGDPPCYPPGRSPDPGDIPVRSRPSQYWGEWMRMDTGDKWYITGRSITVNENNSPGSVSLLIQSERVIEVTEDGRKYYLYASRIANATFTGKIVEFQNSSVRSISSGLGGIQVAISNLKDKVNETTVVTTNGEGIFVAEKIIPGDAYEVTPKGGTTTIVTPQVDGDDVGTFTITQGMNFKTRLIPKSAEISHLYPNTSYSFDLEIENSSDEDCTAATYTLDFGDAVTSSPSAGRFGTIEKHKIKTIPVTLSYRPTLNASDFKYIRIAITDSIANKTWHDSVSLKIYKGTIDFNIRAETKVAGVIISPSAQAYHFAGTTAKVTVPTSDKDYLVVFSGATADTETVYSLGIGVNALDSFSSFMDLGRYEPNNTEAEATKVTEKQIMAYLHKNDIDYYKVNLIGQGNITINPQLTDESIPGFPSEPIYISKSGTPKTLTITEEYAGYTWYVDNVVKNTTGSFTLNAAEYRSGKHTLTLVVYKNGVPYSKEQFFTVGN